MVAGEYGGRWGLQCPAAEGRQGCRAPSPLLHVPPPAANVPRPAALPHCAAAASLGAAAGRGPSHLPGPAAPSPPPPTPHTPTPTYTHTTTHAPVPCRSFLLTLSLPCPPPRSCIGAERPTMHSPAAGPARWTAPHKWLWPPQGTCWSWTQVSRRAGGRAGRRARQVIRHQAGTKGWAFVPARNCAHPISSPRYCRCLPSNRPCRQHAHAGLHQRWRLCCGVERRRHGGGGAPREGFRVVERGRGGMLRRGACGAASLCTSPSAALHIRPRTQRSPAPSACRLPATATRCGRNRTPRCRHGGRRHPWRTHPRPLALPTPLCAQLINPRAVGAAGRWAYVLEGNSTSRGIKRFDAASGEFELGESQRLFCETCGCLRVHMCMRHACMHA